jgi:hypothetical protein
MAVVVGVGIPLLEIGVCIASETLVTEVIDVEGASKVVPFCAAAMMRCCDDGAAVKKRNGTWKSVRLPQPFN